MIEINLKNRKAFITGGSRGIGAEICRVFADCGAEVAFTFKSNRSAAENVIDEIKQKGGRAISYQAPAEDMDLMGQAVASAAEELGGLDILVANVGRSRLLPFKDLTLEDWQEGVETNLTSMYIAIKLAYPHLLKAGHGNVLMIGSSAAYDGGGGAAYYSASKAGLFGLTKKLMREFSSQNIRVNSIHPCVVDTDALHSIQNTPELIEVKRSQVPLGRLSKPTDIAYLAAFLCSDLGEFITGQSILVDGGRTTWKKEKDRNR